MQKWWSQLRRFLLGNPETPKRRSTALMVERLDERCLLSAGLIAAPLASGVGRFGAYNDPPHHKQEESIVGSLATAPSQTSTTVASNGDQNPYGVAFVPQDVRRGGLLEAGAVLVSDFNESTALGNVQGTGSSIVEISKTGQTSTFFQGQAGLGLTTALGVLKSGFVLVGNVPNVGGVAQQGSLLIIDKNGNLVETLTDPTKLDGPWDLTIQEHGDHALVFVSNVLNGTVTRIDLKVHDHGIPVVESMTTIASGYAFNTNGAALVVGPTGLAYDDRRDILYVASTDDNAIFAVPNAAEVGSSNGTGSVVVQNESHMHGPLGLVLAPNGDLIMTNGDAVFANSDVNEIVEYTSQGQFVTEMPVDNTGIPGGAFGIAITSHGDHIRFAAVDDNFNTVTVWSLRRDDH